MKEITFNGLADDEIDEYIPYERTIHSTGGDEAKRFGDMIDWTQVKTNKRGESVHLGGRFSKEDIRWMRKSRNSDSNIRAKIFWYVDFEGRENLKMLIDDLENKIWTDNSSSPYPKGKRQEWFWSADFTEDYSKYDVEPDDLLMDETKEAIFYQKIFHGIHNGKSLGEIVKLVSTDKMTISKPAVSNFKKLIGF
jgi:hypothetical protein